jgi:hypothetical protein
MMRKFRVFAQVVGSRVPLKSIEFYLPTEQRAIGVSQRFGNYL